MLLLTTLVTLLVALCRLRVITYRLSFPPQPLPLLQAEAELLLTLLPPLLTWSFPLHPLIHFLLLLLFSPPCSPSSLHPLIHFRLLLLFSPPAPPPPSGPSLLPFVISEFLKIRNLEKEKGNYQQKERVSNVKKPFLFWEKDFEM